MNININDLVVFILLGSTLIGAFIFLIRVIAMQVHNIRLSTEDKLNKNVLITLLIATILMTVFSLGLFYFVVIMCFFPDVLAKISTIWRLIGIIGIFIFWGCFAGLALGTGDVVGAGYGSATKIFKEIFKSKKL